MSITLDQSRAVIAGAFAHRQAHAMAPLCVCVLDAGGHVVAAAREDGASNGRFDVARGKAYGAISMGMSSRLLGDMALTRPHFVAGVASAIGGSLVPVAGGLIVLDDDGQTVGAVGISGDNSDNDEAAAMAGISAAGLRTVSLHP